MKTVNVKSLGDCPYLISLDPEDTIGQGSYGKVVRAYNKQNPSEENLVAKYFKFSQSRKCASALQQLKIVSQIQKHPNIIQYKKVKITSKNYIYIVMENCSKGSLKQKIQERRKNMQNNLGTAFTEEQIWQFICSFVEGYKVLYQKMIVHRDIKPENILIGSDGKYKIGDFGLSQLIWQLSDQNFQAKVKGSLFFMAPQQFQSEQMKSSNGLLNKVKLGNEHDVYSLGITIYCMCFFRYPYIGSHYPTALKQYLRILKNSELKFPQNSCFYSSQLKELISSMLEKDPSVRCSWQYIFLKTKYKCPKVQSFSSQNQLTLTPAKSIAFKIVQISDTLLKNLSLLDIHLNQSLKKESIVIVDHIEAQILSKRDFIFFCDRLYVQLVKICERYQINGKQNLQQQNTASSKLQMTQSHSKHTSVHREIHLIFQKLNRDLIVSNFLYSSKLHAQFDKYYEKIDKSEFLKVITSRKYDFLKRIINQDFENIQQSIKQQGHFDYVQNVLKFHQQKVYGFIDAQIYQNCGLAIQQVISRKNISLAIQIDHLEQWYEKKSSSILFKTRKNQNALRQFTSKISQLKPQEIFANLSKRYHYLLKNTN